MAAELIAQVDGNTGLPLPIAPTCQWLPMDRPEIADRHHGWHPEKSEALKTVAGIALRNSWIQTVERDFHNQGDKAYHKFYSGPQLPSSRVEIFSRCVIACTGVIPDRVIDLSNGEPKVRTMKRKERRFLRTPSEEDEFGYRYIRYNYEPIRTFFRDFAFEQDLSHLRESFIDEFLFTKDWSRKRKLGKLLVANSVAVASDAVREEYSAIYRKGLMHPRMPREVQTLIGYKLGNRKSEFQLFQQLENRLLVA